MASNGTKKPTAKSETKTKNNIKKKSASAKPKTETKQGTVKRNNEKTAETVQSAISVEVKGILVIAFGIFLLIAFLSDTAGAVGEFLKHLFFGLFGASSTVSCVFIIITGINIFINKRRNIGRGRGLVLAGIVLFTSILTALIYKDTTFGTNSAAEQIAELYHNGADGISGGVIGGGLCRILVGLAGVPGAWITTVAAELILFILLTGVSINAFIKKIAAEHKPVKRETAQDEKASAVKKKENENSSARKTSGFFGEYFKGGEIIGDKGEKNPFDAKHDAEEMPKRQRFEITEDSSILDGILSEEKDKQIDEESLPFKLDNMKTGTISEIPITEADGKITERKNPEDEDDIEFIPPTEAKQNDVMDPLTKKAAEAGIPLDRAVDAGKRMAVSDGELSPEEQIENQIAESAATPQRMVQYRMPTTDLLDKPKPRQKSRSEIKAELEEKANKLLDTLQSFKVEAKIINITQGPSVTRFELQPGVGVKVSKILSLADDIALCLAAPGVRIEAPIPGKSAIGIELPNSTPTPVPIREVLESEKFIGFQSKTAFALGKDIAGTCVVADIAKFPHVLIAGQTGSGKSVCINSLILSILYKARPDEVKLIMVDPKMVELGIYNGIPHLLIPVVTDPKHAAGALNWAVTEMQNRYNLLKDNNVRNLKGYNALMEERGEPESKLPEIVIIIDEFADLMIAAKSEVENAINRLAALARAAGMYLVIATQRPTVNVITGVIKANIPSRIAFNVTSQIDSRTILDAAGADKLLGKGDMLYNPSGAMKPQRIQGNFVSDSEIERVIEYIKSQYEADYDAEIIENIHREQERVTANLEGNSGSDESDDTASRGGGSRDELFIQAVEMVLENGQASVAMFQRRFKIGYQRAARLIDQMEERRIIGPYEGTKPRQVLISRQEFLEMKMNEQNAD